MDDLVVTLGTDRQRRGSLVWSVVLVVLFGFLLVRGDATSRALVAALGVFAVNAGTRTFERLVLTDRDVTFDRRIWRRRVAWDDIARLRVDWTTASAREPRLPLVELRDGRDLRQRRTLVPLADEDRRPEREALESYLRAAASRHRFRLDLVAPKAR